jgi:hypothetical protein
MGPFDDDDDEVYDDDLPGNYPADEDVFRQGLIDADIDPEDISRMKRPSELDADDWNEKTFDDELTGEDLDVPGSEDDDYDEEIGREDEENNYYSLGGDNHEAQEEHIGD